LNPQVAYRKPRDPGYIGGYYWPPSIAGFASLILTNVLATQYVAHHFEYQEALGAELFNLGGFHFYAPYKWLIWLLRFSDSPDIAVKLPLLLSCGIIVAGAFASGRSFSSSTSRTQSPFQRIPRTCTVPRAGPLRKTSRRRRS